MPLVWLCLLACLLCAFAVCFFFHVCVCSLLWPANIHTSWNGNMPHQKINYISMCVRVSSLCVCVVLLSRHHSSTSIMDMCAVLAFCTFTPLNHVHESSHAHYKESIIVLVFNDAICYFRVSSASSVLSILLMLLLISSHHCSLVFMRGQSAVLERLNRS